LELQEMLTPGHASRVHGFNHTDVYHNVLKLAVDEAGARFWAADSRLNEARAALLEAVTASVDAQKKYGNVATIYVELIRVGNTVKPERAAEVPACTEELDAVSAAAFAEFAAARKEYDDASFASREANKAFGQFLVVAGS
jgi:hypothetical protein